MLLSKRWGVMTENDIVFQGLECYLYDVNSEPNQKMEPSIKLFYEQTWKFVGPGDGVRWSPADTITANRTQKVNKIISPQELQRREKAGEFLFALFMMTVVEEGTFSFCDLAP